MPPIAPSDIAPDPTSPAQDAPAEWQRPHDPAATQADIFYCFRLLLGRSPGPDEWTGHAMQAGGALDRIVAAYLNSMEFDRRQLLRRSGAAPLLHQRPGFCIYASPEDPASGELIRRGVYEPSVERLIRGLLRPGMGFIDIGANVGYFTLIAAGIVGARGHVHAVEANPDNARLLEASRLANGFDNVTVLQVAAGARAGLLALHTMHSTGTTSALADSPERVLQSRTVASLRLDDLVPDDPAIGLIKIDIDGGEYQAMRGAARLIAAHRPVLITEFCPGMLHDVSGVDAYTYLDWLRAQGYALSVIPADAAGSPDPHGDPAPDPDPAGDSDNATILQALARRGTDHLDLLARPIGARPPVAAGPAPRQARPIDPGEPTAATQIKAANRHAFDAEQRARAAARETDLLRTAQARDAPRLAALEANVARLEAELAAMRARAQSAEAWLEAVRVSTSWRLTGPLRRLFRRRQETNLIR